MVCSALRNLDREPVVLVVQSCYLTLHPGIEVHIRALIFQEVFHCLRLLDLLLRQLILVIGDLLGDQRADDLPADLHQLTGSKVGLQHPLVGAVLAPRRLCGD